MVSDQPRPCAHASKKLRWWPFVQRKYALWLFSRSFSEGCLSVQKYLPQTIDYSIDRLCKAERSVKNAHFWTGSLACGPVDAYPKGSITVCYNTHKIVTSKIQNKRNSTTGFKQNIRTSMNKTIANIPVKFFYFEFHVELYF